MRHEAGKRVGRLLREDAGALRRLAGTARVLASESDDGLFAVAEFRDRAGIGRNLAVEVLEYFDVAGYTERVGDVRRVVGRLDAIQ